MSAYTVRSTERTFEHGGHDRDRILEQTAAAVVAACGHPLVLAGARLLEEGNECACFNVGVFEVENERFAAEREGQD